MKSRFLPNMESDSIVNYYLLPLTGNSKMDFGDNFVTARINTQGTIVFVEVSADIYSDKIYRNKVILNDKTHLFFPILKKYLNDAKLIIEGKYIEISDAAKDKIISISGLMYLKRTGGNVYTSKMILALYGDKALVDYLYEELRSGTRSDAELKRILNSINLMEKIDETDFIL